MPAKFRSAPPKETMTALGAVLTAMLTPFDDDDAVDYGRAAELARHLVDHGSDGLVVCGTTGESPTLSDDEKVALWRTVVEAVGGRATVVAGTGTYDTRHSVELTERAVDAGCEAVMAVTPYYSKPPQRGLVRHFAAIADAASVPLLLYNIPGRTGRRIEVDTLVELAGHPGIIGVKDAVDDIGFTSRQMAAVPSDFAVYSGSDAYTLPILAVGGVGVVSVASHLVGRQIQRMVAATRDKDWETARSIHLALLPLVDALFLEPNPIPLKAAMSEFWRPVGAPRLPLVTASPETATALREALAAAQRA